jgi:hypothetical protein
MLRVCRYAALQDQSIVHEMQGGRELKLSRLYLPLEDTLRCCHRHHLRNHLVTGRGPSAFRQSDIERALRATRAVGEVPGRITVSRDGGFTIELAPAAPEGTPTAAATTEKEGDAE